MSLLDRHIKALRKKARRGFAGYPAATIAFYGPSDRLATKVAVGIVLGEEQGATVLERWYSEAIDIRADARVMEAALHFIKSYGCKSVVLADRIIGCPHEEGVDYPEGERCPVCVYWADRNRWTGEVEHLGREG